MKKTDLKLFEGRTGDLLLSHLNGRSKCTSQLKMAILSEIDRGHDADFISGFLQAVCHGSTREFLSDRVWTEDWWLLDEKLYFLLCPSFAALRHYCLSHNIPPIHAFKKAVEQEEITFKKLAKKYGYTFKKLLSSYNSIFESNDIKSWIEEGGEFVAFCDLFCIEVETLARSPADWNLSEYSFSIILEDLETVNVDPAVNIDILYGRPPNTAKPREIAYEIMIKNFARLFSLPPDEWFGKKYFHRLRS